jgi:hypothetical protein
MSESIESRIVETINFVRERHEGRDICLLEVFRDGTVCIIGPDVDGGFEECDDAKDRAVKFVESKGYVKCKNF